MVESLITENIKAATQAFADLQRNSPALGTFGAREVALATFNALESGEIQREQALGHAQTLAALTQISGSRAGNKAEIAINGVKPSDVPSLVSNKIGLS